MILAVNIDATPVDAINYHVAEILGVVEYIQLVE